MTVESRFVLGMDQLRAAAKAAKANGKNAIVIVKPDGNSYVIGIAVVEDLLKATGEGAPVLELPLRDAAMLTQDLVAAFKKIQAGEFKLQ